MMTLVTVVGLLAAALVGWIAKRSPLVLTDSPEVVAWNEQAAELAEAERLASADEPVEVSS